MENNFFNILFSIDLSTLANVVTTLALMGKTEGDQPLSNGNQSDVNQSVAKAFDTLAKAIQPQQTSQVGT